MTNKNTQSNLKDFQSHIAQRDATIGIVGLGYVGLPIAMRFAEVGFTVIGFDNDPTKIEKLMAGKSYIGHFSDQQIGMALERGFSATEDFGRAGEADVLLLCLPTPLDKDRGPDLSYVTETMETLAPHLRNGQLLALESTTYPGTTEEELRPRIESQGLEVGSDVYLVYSPEREDPANPNFTTRTIPKVVGGSTPDCLAAGVSLYESIIDTVVPVSSTQVAEMTKLLENIHRAVNIGLVNEMKVVADKMGINIYEVIEAAATKPFGFVPYWPGPGLGGHCIPIDPFYLTWKARQHGVDTRFIELAGEVNRAMPAYVVSKIADALQRQEKTMQGSRILILGLAYKPNVDDARETPSAEIMRQLQVLGAKPSYSDPYIPSFPRMRDYDFAMTSVELTAENIASYDCILVSTNHDVVDYDLVLEHAKVIVDARGVFRGDDGKVIRA